MRDERTEERLETCNFVIFDDGGRGLSQAMIESGKDKEMDSSLEPSTKKAALPTS